LIQYTNEDLPSDLSVKREGNKLILKGRTARIVIFADRWKDVVDAITEVSQQ
jgi:hypothetical protein